MLKRSGVFFLTLSLCVAPFAFAAPVSEKTDKVVREPLPTEEEREADENSPYLIGPQNLLQIKIFGEASMNQLYRVEEDGYIKHALAGRVKLGGLAVADAEKVMEQKLDGDYIINPQVNILVLEYSHFSIIGEVRKPGSYEISGRTSLIRAISIAGGFTPVANQRGVQVMRRNGEGETKINVDTTRAMSGDQSSNMDLQADDVVVIPKSFF